MDYTNCTLCPRACGVDRTAGELGFCGCPAGALVAKAMIHKWEEPALAGNGGSGAVFFGGCTLGCKYCQNAAISGGPVGTAMDPQQLRQLFQSLIDQGAENIDLVTPTHFLPTILPALTPKLPVPVVYNCGGYERVETLKALEGLVDIYLPDFKYMDAERAARYSHAGDYPQIAQAALAEMVRQQPKPEFDERGLMKKGVIVRHLMLPGGIRDSKEVVRYLHETYGEHIFLSLMNQYTPLPYVADYPEINRKLKKFEYERLVDYAISIGVDQGFIQEGETAEESFIPSFENEGV